MSDLSWSPRSLSEAPSSYSGFFVFMLRYSSIILLKISLLEGGVKTMVFAPAAMVSRMDSSVLPPLAMMGSDGYCSLMRATASAVRLPAATLMIEAPASILAWTSSSSVTTVAMMGMS